MRLRGGVVPPGKAGVVVVAVALLPVLIAEAKPAIRAATQRAKGLAAKIRRRVS